MPLVFIPPPRALTEATLTGLHDMAQNQHFRVQALVAATPEQLTVASAHPVYGVDLDQLSADIALASLIQTNWRFIVHRDGRAVATAESQGLLSGGAVQLASVDSGPFVDGTVHALHRLAHDPAFADGDWEVRVLRVPALSVSAAWLHERQRGDDVIRVMQPAPAYLDPDRSYRWDDFKAALHGPAADRLHASEQPGP